MIQAVLFAGFGIAFAKRVEHFASEKVNAASGVTTTGSCAVGWLNGICECDYSSTKFTGTIYKCSACKDPTLWGYGCDLDCDPSCGAQGCDFSGNCIVKPETLKNARCKRNSRVPRSEKTEETLNERGECRACEREAFGVHCEKRCADISKNCVTTAEGNCTRGGSCYACKDGFYGKDCKAACPSGCRKCAMVDNLDKANSGEFLPEGACLDQCKTDTWGSKCDKKCPSNCKKTSTPSCDKSLGNCYKCGTDSSRKPNKPHQWWGDKCETKCADGCEDFQCIKKNGHCEAGVKTGFCGRKGDKHCPPGTIGACDKGTCMPTRCEEGKYPFMLADPKSGSETAQCVECPANCADGCEQDGTCKNKGCSEGYFGPQCDQECPGGCDGGCDKDGKCSTCQTGLTGAKCDKSCHRTCETCTQYSGLFGAPGNNAHDCLSCPDDKPSMFSKATKMCECIEGAEYSEQLGECVCSAPGETNLEAYFVSRPKACLKKCKKGLRAAYALDGQKFKCFTGKVYKSVVREEALASDRGETLTQGSCESGEYEIHIKSSNPQDVEEEKECIETAFVDYILHE